MTLRIIIKSEKQYHHVIPDRKQFKTNYSNIIFIMFWWKSLTIWIFAEDINKYDFESVRVRSGPSVWLSVNMIRCDCCAVEGKFYIYMDAHERQRTFTDVNGRSWTLIREFGCLAAQFANGIAVMIHASWFKIRDSWFIGDDSWCMNHDFCIKLFIRGTRITG